MHIPDGFLSLPVTVAAAAISAPTVSLAFRKIRGELGPAHVPLVGTTAAFVFAAQMINIPVAAGTSGHFLGATLATLLLGPAAAMIVMTLVLLIQALLFADGGVLALGANILNMAVVPPLVTVAILRIARRGAVGRSMPLTVLGAIAGWVSVVVASGLCAAQVALAGGAPWALVMPAMLGWHALIGLIEAAVTGAVISTVAALRPDLISEGASGARSAGDSAWVTS